MAIAMKRGCLVMRKAPLGVGSPGTTPAGLGRTKLATSKMKAEAIPTYIVQRIHGPRGSAHSHGPVCLFAKYVHTSGMKNASASNEYSPRNAGNPTRSTNRSRIGRLD